jgi:hypothetical protein
MRNPNTNSNNLDSHKVMDSRSTSSSSPESNKAMVSHMIMFVFQLSPCIAPGTSIGLSTKMFFCTSRSRTNHLDI